MVNGAGGVEETAEEQLDRIYEAYLHTHQNQRKDNMRKTYDDPMVVKKIDTPNKEVTLSFTTTPNRLLERFAREKDVCVNLVAPDFVVGPTWVPVDQALPAPFTKGADDSSDVLCNCLPSGNDGSMHLEILHYNYRLGRFVGTTESKEHLVSHWSFVEPVRKECLSPNVILTNHEESSV
jgi:hypothetical protein